MWIEARRTMLALSARMGRRLSAELYRAPRHAEPEAVDDRALGGQLVRGRAERDEQRREVFGAGVGEAAGRGLVLEVEQAVDVAGFQRAAAPVIELGHDGR